MKNASARQRRIPVLASNVSLLEIMTRASSRVDTALEAEHAAQRIISATASARDEAKIALSA